MSGLMALLLLPTAGSCVAVPSNSPEASPSQIQHHILLTASCSQLPRGVLGLPCLRSWHRPHSCPGLGLTASLYPTALGILQVTPKPLPCTQAAVAADPHLTLSYLEKDFVSRKEAAGPWGAHSLVAQLTSLRKFQRKAQSLVWTGSQSSALHPWQREQLGPKPAAIPKGSRKEN